MARRNVIAGLLFLVVMIASAGEYFSLAYQSIYQTVYITTLIAVAVLAVLWLFADAQNAGLQRPSQTAYFSTILLPPLGYVIYFFQTRSPLRAIRALALCALFVMMAALLGLIVGEQLFHLVRSPR